MIFCFQNNQRQLLNRRVPRGLCKLSVAPNHRVILGLFVSLAEKYVTSFFVLCFLCRWRPSVGREPQCWSLRGHGKRPSMSQRVTSKPKSWPQRERRSSRSTKLLVGAFYFLLKETTVSLTGTFPCRNHGSTYVIEGLVNLGLRPSLH